MDSKEVREKVTFLKQISLRVLILLFLNVTLWLSGSILFIYLEGSNEGIHKCGVKRVKRDFLDMLWSEAGNLDELDWKSLARKKLETFEDEIHTAVEAGVKSATLADVWSHSNALLYTFTLSTTIGYGSLTPKSEWVRILSLGYAGIACPLFGLLLSNVGVLISTILNIQEGCPKIKRISTILVVYSLSGSILFSILFNWSTMDSFYFLLTTFSTVGFGDFFPEDAFLYLTCGLYIIIGLSLFSLYQEYVMDKLSSMLDWMLQRQRTSPKLHSE